MKRESPTVHGGELSISEVRETYPLPTIHGLPVLDEHLRWPGCELFIMGGAAALQLGPVARNIFGGRIASQRIVPALVKNTIARSSGLLSVVG